MNAHSARREFESIIDANTQSLASLTAEDGIALMLAFFRERRADDCPLDSAGDMLLFQWGTYDWGKGEFFEFDITRQFILDGEAEDENIWQLSLTFKYVATDTLFALGAGEEWCPSPRPRAVDHFDSIIRCSDSFNVIREIDPAKTELDYECVG